MAYGGRYFALAEVDDGGKSKRERLERRLERARDAAEVAALEGELALPAFPAELGYLWRAYVRLRRRGGVGFSGALPLAWHDIDAYCRLTRTRFAPWEIEILEALDDSFLRPDAAAAPAPLVLPDGQRVRAIASFDNGAAVKALMGSIAGKRIVVRRNKGAANA
jgi:hypothetical protein